MCNPALMAMGVMAAGTGLQMKAQSKQDKARAEAMKAERLRQDGISKQAQSQFADQLATFSGTKQQAATDKRQADQDALNAAATGDYNASDLAPSDLMNLTGGTNDAISNEIMRGLAEGQDRAGRKSAFDAYGRAGTDLNRSIRKTNSDLGNLASFASGSANVLPYELQAANQKGRTMSTIGQLLGSVGSIGAMYGANQPAPTPNTAKP